MKKYKSIIMKKYRKKELFKSVKPKEIEKIIQPISKKFNNNKKIIIKKYPQIQ